MITYLLGIVLRGNLIRLSTFALRFRKRVFEGPHALDPGLKPRRRGWKMHAATIRNTTRAPACIFEQL
jgi:hypothetical protein